MKLRKLWVELRGSFWFAPSLIIIFSVALALGLIDAESLVASETLAKWPRLFGAGAEGSRGMLAAIAGSVITVAGVAFSITVVTLTLASSQYTPRILRNFMRDRANQVVLGVFVGVFAYCLIVLRAIRGGDDSFVPSLATLGGFILALVSVGVLIFFIHHIALTIQASTIIASIAEETTEAIDRLFPEELGHEGDEGESEKPEVRLTSLPWRPVTAPRSGYIQNVDNEALLRSAHDLRSVIRMERGVGEFVVEGAPLVSISSEVDPDRETIRRLRKAYAIDRYRTVEQDAGFGIRQIVDVALKALSPGINDTTTAVMCVDYLTAILARLARRRIPSRYRFNEGELRVIARGPTFERMLHAFDQIRRDAESKVAVIVRILDGLQILATETRGARRRRALWLQLEALNETAERAVISPRDRSVIKERVDRVAKRLNEVELSEYLSFRREEETKGPGS
ncbi:MAG TPA: DUF2254 domain-containing protein, partial [Blastocatellia bacterium]|nr:DUF2254 domain-containing protein [Blastocatellia bacterium]